MMRTSQILLLIFIFQSAWAIACECSPLEDHDKLIEESYSYYEDIFIGKVVKAANELRIEVMEVFKGNLNVGQVLKPGYEGSSCDYYFAEEGDGLFYGLVSAKRFYASMCSPTRMFKRPYLYPPPPPPLPGRELDEKAEERKMKEYEEKERKRLLYEIEELRKK